MQSLGSRTRRWTPTQPLYETAPDKSKEGDVDKQRIYLLCIWSEGGSEARRPSPRVILEEPRTGRQWGFATPGRLASFLESAGLSESAAQPASDAG
jgi:hypothetical protein